LTYEQDDHRGPYGIRGGMTGDERRAMLAAVGDLVSFGGAQDDRDSSGSYPPELGSPKRPCATAGGDHATRHEDGPTVPTRPRSTGPDPFGAQRGSWGPSCRSVAL